MRLAAALLICSFGMAADVRLHLATASGRTKFHMGESIELKITLEASSPAEWRFDRSQAGRTTRGHGLDFFAVTPSDGVADPLSDRFAQFEGMAGSFARVPGAPPTVNEFLNEWVSFRKAGKYTVVLKSKRAGRVVDEERSAPVELESNPIAIEIVDPPAGWVAETLAKARTALEGVAPGIATPDTVSFSRTLRFLETKEAVRVMAESFARNGDTQLAAGLWGSPHRDLAIATMEQLLTAPEVAVGQYWLGTLVELSARRELPVMGPYPQDDELKRQEWQAEQRQQGEVIRAHAARYHAMLLEALPNKRPQARLVSALGLYHARAAISPDTLRRILLSEVPDDEGVRFALLNDFWPIVASPEIVPFLGRLAGADTPRSAYSRVMALQRLFEIEPALGRERILAELTRTDGYLTNQQHFLLPDRELPELDGDFIERLSQPNPPWMLIARYGTRRVLAAAIDAYEKPERPCIANEALIYFFRVDPEEGKRRLAARREERTGQPACGQFGVPGNPRELMSEGLEDALVSDLESEDQGARRYAAFVLGMAGTARVEPHLWRAMERWREGLGDSPKTLNLGDRAMEQTFSMAITNARGWLPTPERLDRLSKLCVSERCRESVKGAEGAIQRMARISMHSGNGRTEFSIGGAPLSDPDHIRERLRQFPKGFEFKVRFEHRGTWYTNRVESRLRELFEAEGMKLQIETTGDAAPH